MQRCAKPSGLRSFTPLDRSRLAPLCAVKGFDDGSKNASNVKMSDRGKPSTRPGPISPKEARKAHKQEKSQQKAGLQQAEQSSPEGSNDTLPRTTQIVPTPQQPRINQPAEPESQIQRPSVATTPQAVVDRMFVRMITCAGIPVFLGLLTLPLFWYLKVKADVEYPMWIVYLGQALTFGGGLLGITYGILSTSWDPNREGSFWGFTEVQANLPLLLSRNKRG